jgi:flagellar assembly protein FliH
VPAAEAPAAPVAARPAAVAARAAAAVAEPAPAGSTGRRATEGGYDGPERRGSVRRAADLPVPGAPLRLGDVYAEELARLRGRAHEEGYAAGFAEGTAAAEVVVARAEAEAAARLAEVQTRWERRMGSAAAALAAAARRLEETTVPVAEDVRDTVLGAVATLVEDVLGRELALAASPGLDAVRRALTLCPEDAPAVVRLHPDDLAEVPAEALAGLPATVTVVGDPRVERAGAVAETGARRIDAQLGPALERVQAVLAL